MRGRLNLDEKTLDLNGGTLNLDWRRYSTISFIEYLNCSVLPLRTPYNLSTGLRGIVEQVWDTSLLSQVVSMILT